MHPSHMHYAPLTWPFLLILAAIFALVITLIELNVLRYAYERIGISRRYVFGLLLLSLFGSGVNIPVAELPPEPLRSDEVVDYAGMTWIIPSARQERGPIIAVNLGGAVIPTLLSIYLILRNRLFIRGLIGIAIVTAVVHMLAHPIRGVGIAVPVFIPPIAAAIVATILARLGPPSAVAGAPQANIAPALAYISGSMGALIGADLLNLGLIQGLGAPIASIGGAGTFDGIFLTGIIAVLLA